VEKKIIAGRDVKFDEGNVTKIKGNIGNLEFDESDSKLNIVSDAEKENVSELDCNVDNGGNNGNSVPELRRSERIKKPPKYLEDYAACAYNVESYINDLPDYEELVDRKDKENWLQAVHEELESLEENNTWEVVPKPTGKKVIDNKWVFTLKRNDSDEIERYKARLVIKGCAQKRGIDYEETYAPVARLTTLRTLLSVITVQNMHAHQLDVQNAFLHGVLKEEIFMRPPTGLNIGNGRVCHLNKTLYG
jgi:hypothetical protein